jgi:hypothetical protein
MFNEVVLNIAGLVIGILFYIYRQDVGRDAAKWNETAWQRTTLPVKYYIVGYGVGGAVISIICAGNLIYIVFKYSLSG